MAIRPIWAADYSLGSYNPSWTIHSQVSQLQVVFNSVYVWKYSLTYIVASSVVIPTVTRPWPMQDKRPQSGSRSPPSLTSSSSRRWLELFKLHWTLSLHCLERRRFKSTWKSGLISERLTMQSATRVFHAPRWWLNFHSLISWTVQRSGIIRHILSRTLWYVLRWFDNGWRSFLLRTRTSRWSLIEVSLRSWCKGNDSICVVSFSSKVLQLDASLDVNTFVRDSHVQIRMWWRSEES